MPRTDFLKLFNDGQEVWEMGGVCANCCCNDRERRVYLGNGQVSRQVTFLFRVEPEVRFGSYHHGLFYGDRRYGDLPIASLTDVQLSKAQHNWEEHCKKNKDAFNGNHVLITDLSYDAFENVIYVGAARCDYMTLRYTQSSYATEFSGKYYRTGTLSPVITSDNCTFLMQRSADNWYSVPGGFLGPDEETDKIDLKVNAGKELREELFSGREETKEEDERVTDEKALKLCGIAIREKVGYMPVVEWMLPVKVSYSYDTMKERVENNTAEDAREHTKSMIRCPLKSFGSSSEKNKDEITAKELLCPLFVQVGDNVPLMRSILTVGYAYAQGSVGKSCVEAHPESPDDARNAIAEHFEGEMPNGVVALSREMPVPIVHYKAGALRGQFH